MPDSSRFVPLSERYVPMEVLRDGVRTWEESVRDVGEQVLWDSLHSVADATQGRGVWAPRDALPVALGTLYERAVHVVEVPASHLRAVS